MIMKELAGWKADTMMKFNRKLETYGDAGAGGIRKEQPLVEGVQRERTRNYTKYKTVGGLVIFGINGYRPGDYNYAGTQRIIQVKRNDDSIFSYYQACIARFVKASVDLDDIRALCLIPSSGKGSKANGIVENLAKQFYGAYYKKFPQRENDMILVPLERTKNTSQQHTLTAGGRAANVQDSLVASPDVKGLKAVIFDDVSTSGSSMREAKRAIEVQGGTVAFGFALALTESINTYGSIGEKFVSEVLR